MFECFHAKYQNSESKESKALRKCNSIWQKPSWPMRRRPRRRFLCTVQRREKQYATNIKNAYKCLLNHQIVSCFVVFPRFSIQNCILSCFWRGREKVLPGGLPTPSNPKPRQCSQPQVFPAHSWIQLDV